MPRARHLDVLRSVLPPVRVGELELLRWKAVAGLEGLSLSEWVRRELGQAADFALGVKPTR